MKQLLLVDNDPEILELLRIGLEDMGLTIRTAGSGVEALRAIEEELPDILVTDLVMPNIGGEKLLKIVRTVPEWDALKTIVISGVAAEAPEFRDRVPCDVYIAKGPIARTLQHLRESIDRFRHGGESSHTGILGIEEIHSRHITRELFEFKAEVDSVMDQIADGICRLDRWGTLLWINQAFSRLIGIPEERMLGRLIYSFLPEKSRMRVEELASASSPVPVEIELEQDGPRRILRATRLAGLSESDPFTTIAWQDVTERLISEEQYENIVESTSDLVLTTDLKGRIDFASSSSRRVTGRAPEALRRHFLWELAPADDREPVRDRFLRTISGFLADTAQEQDLWEMPLHGPEDEPRLGSVTCSPFRSKGGTIMGTQLVITDITDRRRLEEERTALLHEVQHRVRDNLQLVASLVRLSGPEQMDMRIAAVSEVFDELYRERSFSRIHARSLLERVVALGIAEGCHCRRYPVRYRIETEYVPMRTAVPLSLLVVEAIGEIGRRQDNDCSLSVELYPVEGETVMSVSCADGTPQWESAAEREPEEEGIISILTSQLNGRCRILEGPSSAMSYTFVFVPERPVP